MATISSVRAVPSQPGNATTDRVAEVRALSQSRAPASGAEAEKFAPSNIGSSIPSAFSDQLEKIAADQPYDFAPVGLSPSVVTVAQQVGQTAADEATGEDEASRRAGQAAYAAQQSTADEEKEQAPIWGLDDESAQSDLLPPLGEMTLDDLAPALAPDIVKTLAALNESSTEAAPATTAQMAFGDQTNLLGQNGNLFSQMKLAASAYAQSLGASAQEISASA